MIPLISTIFVASIAGSLHCAGMCGAFVALAVGGPDAPRTGRALLLVAYNGGRLVTYTALGIAAGLLGAGVDLAGSLGGVNRAAGIVAGVAMVAFGVATLSRVLGARLPRMPIPRYMQNLFAAGHEAAMSRNPVVRAWLIGLLTTLLPCGWLYAFVIVAAGTGSPMLGGLSMIVFWMGTLPVLLALGAGIQRLLGPLAAHAPVLASLAIITVGLLTVAGRMAVAPPVASAHTDQTLVEQVRLLDPKDAVCHDGTP